MSSAAVAQNAQAALKASVGFRALRDGRHVAAEAAEIVRAGLDGATAQLALVVTAGADAADPTRAVREVLGPISVAGASTSGLLLNSGVETEGVLVVGLATEGDVATGTACLGAPDLSEAGRATARLIMSGWPFRLRYPRGLGIAFVGGGSPILFLESWRQFMGPKMRTLCGAMPGGVVYGSPTAGRLASVACVEAAYATGLGYAEGFEPDHVPDTATLIHGATEATATALKRLDERSARLVLVLDTVARRAALGGSADAEWSAILSEVGDRAPCVGWLCERVGGYGRGIQPTDQPGALMIAAIGDPPPVSD
jgi:hypothetical protein